MSSTKSTPTLIVIYHPLTLEGESLFPNATEFWAIVGALQYLSLTHPSFCSSVNRLLVYYDILQAGPPITVSFYTATPLTLYIPLLMLIGSVTRMTKSPRQGILCILNPISWSFHEQRTHAQPTTEVEYRAIANTRAELGVKPIAPPTIYCDNKGATHVVANPKFHSKMKHLALDYHFVRKYVQDGCILISYILETNQSADALTNL
ncbi:hypothetical protein OSB04_005846 [Centaurea solstitialis]|uniref:Uncharacterized protein n=1 Tax=Centaurea solstitialis TaxID=347529 RepID=A0AA38TUN2_9ASTR|nr:hypothetical protein OSB04_005846 [Centaurea solstitialis]